MASSLNAIFKFDFRFDDLSLTLTGSGRAIAPPVTAAVLTWAVIALRIGLSSGGLARLGDKEFRFIVDVLARGELNVNEFSTSCCPSGGVITTLFVSQRVCRIDTAIFGTIRRLARLSGFTNPLRDEVVVVARRLSSLEAARFTERFLRIISGPAFATAEDEEFTSVVAVGCEFGRLLWSIEGEVDFAFCSAQRCQEDVNKK